MNARLLRALVGANDQLRAGYLATDNAEVRRRLVAITTDLNEVVGLVARGPSAIDEDPDLAKVIS